MRRDSSYSRVGKTEDSLGCACVGPPRDDATAQRTWDRGRRSSSSSSCPCTVSMMSLSTLTVHGTLYCGTVPCHCTLHIAIAHRHYIVSLYILSVHCTLYTVLPKVS